MAPDAVQRLRRPVAGIQVLADVDPDEVLATAQASSMAVSPVGVVRKHSLQDTDEAPGRSVAFAGFVDPRGVMLAVQDIDDVGGKPVAR